MNLQYWLDIQKKCIGRALAYHQLNDDGKAQRYSDLLDWTDKRIIGKYDPKANKDKK